MAMLVVGLMVFFGVHLVPMLAPMRARLYEGAGEKRYKAVFSLVAALGLILIVAGYAYAPAEPRQFAPLPAARAAAPAAMLISFILLAASHMKTHIRAAVRHPMLIGVGIWSGVHLLANGETRATLLFGAFLAYSVLDLISAIARRTFKPFKPVARQDLIAVVAGIALALLVMALHRPLFGVAAVPWGW